MEFNLKLLTVSHLTLCAYALLSEGQNVTFVHMLTWLVYMLAGLHTRTRAGQGLDSTT